MTELGILFRLFLMFVLGFVFLLLLFFVNLGWWVFNIPTRLLNRGKKWSS